MNLPPAAQLGELRALFSANLVCVQALLVILCLWDGMAGKGKGKLPEMGSENVIVALVPEPSLEGWDFDLPEFFYLNDDGEECG